MSRHPSARTCLTPPEFLAALERSGVLPDDKWREVQDRFVRNSGRVDSLALAEQLIEEGALNEFQARRLLKGKKALSFGRYALVDRIGQGGRGRVFKARHRLMDRMVALKVMSPDTAISERAVARFFREMKIVAILDHPHVVRAIDADIHEGCPYIVMEYLEGDDLEHVLARRGPLKEDAAITYMAQAARGLAHAHERGVIHRDIKPTNVFLTNTGIVKVLDLGCGELFGSGAQAGNVFDTDEGIVVGTTDFMSPEQVKDKPIDARTDLFSLGCTMYRLLTAEYAFPGVTREDRLVKRIKGRHVPISEVRKGLSSGLIAIVDRLLAVRPDDRFDSAAQVADALEALINPASPSERGSTTKPASKSSIATNLSPPDEPEAPLDWSLIESALRPKQHGARQDSRLVERSEPKPPSTKGLSTHRSFLEDAGNESGREVQKKYRNEVIQMNKALAEMRSADSKTEAPSEDSTWLERLGEKFGDFLAEPSAGQILIVVLTVLLIVAMAFAFALA